MTLTVNGQSQQAAEGITLGGLLSAMNVVPEHVATMVNGDVVSRDHRSARVLQDGDVVEVLTLAAGG